VFQGIKKAFTSEPVLVVLDLDREMQVKADTSDYVTGGVLLVKCEDGITNGHLLICDCLI